jgi:uncharacterized Fe-S cluster-containing radical SAM superfamily enzyme
LLGVNFAPNAKKRLDLNKVLNVDENQWPSAVQQRISPLLVPGMTDDQGWHFVYSSWKLSIWKQRPVLTPTKLLILRKTSEERLPEYRL